MIDPNLISMIGGATQAAAAQAKQQEEEEMTGYSDQELAEKWEFKIIRSGTGAFRHRQKLRDALQEEGEAGWEFVEKFDDHRVRLRRPAAAGRHDQRLEFDPYRTWIGVSDAGLVLRVLAGTLVCALLVGAIVAVLFLVNN